MTAAQGPHHIHAELTEEGLFPRNDIFVFPKDVRSRLVVQPPSINRAVHYHDLEYDREGGEPRIICRAAIVTDVFDPTDPYSPVGLAVIYRGVSFTEHTPYAMAEEKVAGTWHWAENVEPIEIVQRVPDEAPAAEDAP